MTARVLPFVPPRDPEPDPPALTVQRTPAGWR